LLEGIRENGIRTIYTQLAEIKIKRKCFLKGWAKINFTYQATTLEGLSVIIPKVYEDNRGFFMETWQKETFEQLGIVCNYVQDNHSKSKKGVLRGIHFQEKHLQAKLVRCISGKILDVAVDLREGSKTFGQSFNLILSEENKKLLFIPEGFGHGFLALEDDSQLLYKTNAYYCPEYDSGIVFNDTDLDVDWQTEKFGIDEIILSEKDKKLQTFSEWLKKRNGRGL